MNARTSINEKAILDELDQQMKVRVPQSFDHYLKLAACWQLHLLI
jgi:hypothetical protein